jgi:hypothetical protein
MTFLIKGGYDIFRKQVLNISLKRTNIWTQGIVTVRQNKYVCGIIPLNENKLEIVKYDNRHALLLNNSIIYEDRKLFTYKIDLQVGSDLNDRVVIDIKDPSLSNFIDFQYLDYADLKQFNTRCFTN